MSNSPIYAHIWACYGGTANKNATSLKNGSILVTHIESKEAASTHLYNNSIQHSLNRYLKENLSPYQQFIGDLGENYETATFNKKTNDGLHKKFKTIRTPKNDTMAHIIKQIDKSSSLSDFTNEFFANECKRFKDSFDKDIPILDKAKINKSIETVTHLTEEQAKNYLGVLIHISNSKQTDNINLDNFIKTLKSKGVNTNNSVNGITSLDYAIGDHGGDNIETLIKNGALYNSIDAKRTTPLHLACMYKNFTAVNILTKYGADVNLPNMNGHTPLSFAVFNKDKKSIDILLKNNNLHVDAESGNFIILKNIQKYFKDIEISVDTKKNIIDIVKTTTKQLRESNPSINFYSIVQGKGYEKFFNATLSAAADNQKQELIDLSKNIISKAELHKDIATVRNNIKEHINEHLSYNNITTKTNNQTKNKGVSLGK